MKWSCCCLFPHLGVPTGSRFLPAQDAGAPKTISLAHRAKALADCIDKIGVRGVHLGINHHHPDIGSPEGLCTSDIFSFDRMY